MRLALVSNSAAWAVRWVLAGLTTFAVSPGVCQVPSGTGQIAGSVQTADGKPGARIPVGINVRPVKLGEPFPPFNAVVMTGADGGFSLSGVPAATYAICPRPEDPALLAPCSWGTELKVSVARGQSVVVPQIRLQTGAELYVRVKDPNGTRAQQEGKVAGASLFLGVRIPNGTVLPIPLTGSDKSGFDHRLTVPTETDLVIVAFSNTFSLQDGAGAAVGKNGSALTIHIPAGQKQHVEVIQIK